MTLIFERDLYMVKMNRCTKYLGQMSFCLNVIFRGTHTHTHLTYAFTGPLKC